MPSEHGWYLAWGSIAVDTKQCRSTFNPCVKSIGGRLRVKRRRGRGQKDLQVTVTSAGEGRVLRLMPSVVERMTMRRSQSFGDDAAVHHDTPEPPTRACAWFDVLLLNSTRLARKALSSAPPPWRQAAQG
ncbi:hypothetical protein DCS_03802 [Drechmeria coniospora]|uniref:Uncharacterized protein n=1 Tax=Drechmeria coniospora TaxID=98403 RepID=A0A151GI71_DRECN|nr:hypothetical protein DCS_03802 [Drechmeria coniospora]KYK56796.1 hypothetical protein DCS_03802 [Drechmeria coniospora]